MSEMINNRQYRQKVLKELITELHNGKSADEVKERFERLIEGVSIQEITEMEQALIEEGMPIEQIQNLCDVHAALFKGSIEEIHREQRPEDTPGHPVHTLRLENSEIENLINRRLRPLIEQLNASPSPEGLQALGEAIALLGEIDRHYLRKENLLFPYMEKYGITAPPKVMWGVDDEIRALIKEAKGLLSAGVKQAQAAAQKAAEAADRIIDMIFKEEHILFPMITDTLSEDEWVKIARASDEIGYALIAPQKGWSPAASDIKAKEGAQGKSPLANGYVEFDAGALEPEELNAMLNTLPLDITFVDKDGAVKYFTQGKERIFARPKTIIGRLVQNCHPPASVHIVEEIVADLKSGKKEHEDFWIHMGDKYAFIRYFAVRNASGEYLGVMEVTQDIAPIRRIEGEKRLVSE